MPLVATTSHYAESRRAEIPAPVFEYYGEFGLHAAIGSYDPARIPVRSQLHPPSKDELVLLRNTFERAILCLKNGQRSESWMPAV